MAAIQVKKLSINDLRKGDVNDPIWVLNGTMKNPADRANVYIGLPSRDGEAQEPIVVFASWVPTCVTDKIDRAHLLKARNFLTALERGSLVAISNEEAQRMLAQPGAEDELNRVRQLDLANATGDALGSAEEESSYVEIQTPDGSTMPQDPVSPAVYQFIGLLETATGVEALNSLRNLGELNVDEYQAVLKEARGLGEAYKDVQNFCRQRLAALNPSQQRQPQQAAADRPIAVGGNPRRVL